MNYNLRDAFDLYYNILLHMMKTGIYNKVNTIDISESNEIKNKLVDVLNSVESYANRPTNVERLPNSCKDPKNSYNNALEICGLTLIYNCSSALN